MFTKTMLLTLLGTVTIAGHLTAAVADEAGYERSPAPAPLEGSWVVKIRPIFCSGPTAGSDVPGGGSLVEETSNPNLGAGKRTGGNGWWERTGRTSFQFAFQAFLVEPLAPYKTGLQRIEQTLELHTDYEWSSSGPVQFFETFDLADAPGLAPYRAGCARANGVRMR
jgi:hypothetical protein